MVQNQNQNQNQKINRNMAKNTNFPPVAPVERPKRSWNDVRTLGDLSEYIQDNHDLNHSIAGLKGILSMYVKGLPGKK